MSVYGSSRPSPDSLGRTCSCSWNHTAIRVTQPNISIPFYLNHFGMSMVYQHTLNDLTSYFLVTLKKGDVVPDLGENAEKYITEYSGTFLVLLHFHATPVDIKMNNGNEEPHRGFGHIAFNCNDVYKSSQTLEENGVAFRKRPDEGRMKGLAFALDPDGYWIEIVGRGNSCMPEEYNLSQTMIRIKDPKVAIPFYRDVLGMTVVREMHMSDFSNFFLASLPIGVQAPVPPDHADAKHFVHSLFNPCLELTHNHGTEAMPEFRYHNGNTEPVGFSHLSFSVDDLQKFIASQGNTSLVDPDGYVIKICQRGGKCS